MLLDQYCCPAALLKPLLLIVASELALNQDGRLSHFLIECKLQGRRGDRGRNGGTETQAPAGHPEVSLLQIPFSNPHSRPDLMPNTLSAIQVSLWRERGS